jgi:hypothetical protein
MEDMARRDLAHWLDGYNYIFIFVIINSSDIKYPFLIYKY